MSQAFQFQAVLHGPAVLPLPLTGPRSFEIQSRCCTKHASPIRHSVPAVGICQSCGISSSASTSGMEATGLRVGPGGRSLETLLAKKPTRWRRRGGLTVMSGVEGQSDMAVLDEERRSSDHPVRLFLKGTREALGLARSPIRADDVGRDIAALALPAFLSQAIDPVASLAETAFVGRIGPVEIAAVGVSISVFNLVSKLFNFPLLNVTTSFVAEDQASADELAKENPVPEEGSQKVTLPSVSAALVLATGLGVFEALVMAFAAGPILSVMGVPVGTAMRIPAERYLALRAIGAPAVVVSLAVQGVFRGFKDTKTPLKATVTGNLMNVVLDPLLMFTCSLGVNGAAIATVFSQYVIAGWLLLSLNKKCTLLPPRIGDLKFDRFLKSGGLLLGRTLALLSTMTLATSMAARQGTTAMAAHQICLQLWLATSLLSDSLALAGQSLLASAFASKDTKRLKEVAFRILQLGFCMGILMATILILGAEVIPGLFTKDAGVRNIMLTILPFVAATQPITALAFVFDGVHYGASDFAYAAQAMILATLPTVLCLFIAPQLWGVLGVWMGLTLVMSLRMFAGFLRFGTASGPWEVLNLKEEESARLLPQDSNNVF